MTAPGAPPRSGGRIPGRATQEGTARYRDRFSSRVAADHFGHHAGLWLSSIGIGTYLGEPVEAHDAGYRDSVAAAVRSGCNVIDTAINYRFQRSERCVGAALGTLMSQGFRRDEIVVATKGGFIPFDAESPGDPDGWFTEMLRKPGIAEPGDVVADCHIMTPRYLETQIEWSRANLGLDALDIYYLHNPETQLQEVERPEFLMRVRAAFEMLERKAAQGVIGIYGVATWDGFRVPPDHPGHLSLRELLAAAAQAGGARHHFRAIQLPVNLAMGEACLDRTQAGDGGLASLLDAARGAGMLVMASASLLQGRVIEAMGPEFLRQVPGAVGGAQAGLQIARSAPGVATALVGMRQPAHVAQNLALSAAPRLPEREAVRILKACRGGR